MESNFVPFIVVRRQLCNHIRKVIGEDKNTLPVCFSEQEVKRVSV